MSSMFENMTWAHFVVYFVIFSLLYSIPFCKKIIDGLFSLYPIFIFLYWAWVAISFGESCHTIVLAAQKYLETK